MILTQKEVGFLSNLILDFEVVYRSFIAKRIQTKCNSEEIFEKKIHSIKSLYQNSKLDVDVMPLNYLKLKNKTQTYNSSKIKDVYEAIRKTNDCILQKKMVYKEQDVLMFAELIEIVVFFYKPIFEDVGTKFGGGEILEQELEMFRKVRNAASHRGSKIINHQEATQVVKFIQKNIFFMEEACFWYISQQDLEEQAVSFLQNLNPANKVKNNLHQVHKKHTILLERDKEYGTLKERILGKTGSHRKSGTVLIQGSGGVGKTALVLELCYEILSREEELNTNFIMFLTSKEEELSFNSVTGEMRLDKLTPKYSNLEDVKEGLLKLLSLEIDHKDMMSYLEELNGIIVLDNFETISQTEQQKISDFIEECPENIQFILTSRPTDKILENYVLGVPINLMGLNQEKSKKFVYDYLLENNFNVEINEPNLIDFAKESCGNPLIMVMGLQRIISNLVTLEELVQTLRNYSSAEVDTISDFMYKNMMEDTISNIGDKYNKDNLVVNILNAMYLYNDPIDIYSLRDITKLESKEVEAVLKELQLKYIVFKQNGLYNLDDLAIKFILIKKTLPPRVQHLKLKNEITEYKNDIRKQLDSLKERRETNSKLNIILSNWSPNSYSEEIAIAQAFHYFKSYKNRLSSLNIKGNINNTQILELYKEVNKNFKVLKYRGNHPYIEFQQARVLKLFLRYRRSVNSSLFDDIVASIIESYAEANYRINSTHTYVLNTKSHAALLMQNGAFLLDSLKVVEAVKLLEEAVDLYDKKFERDPEEKINRINAYYYLILGEIGLAITDEENTYAYLDGIQKYIEIFKKIEKEVDTININDWAKKKIRINFIEMFIKLKLNKRYILTNEEIQFFNTNKNTWMTRSLNNLDFVKLLKSLI
ncbi:NB-ARC domain-containing protein [Bacillus altitudinis]|uniref:NB-ARC domain-containing protein n=1 Tax=Bacillus altitudinis TaxID=293387 RepID=UPI003CEA093C